MPSHLQGGIEPWVLGFLDAPPKSSLSGECRQNKVTRDIRPELPVTAKAEMSLTRTRVLGALGSTD